MLSFKEYLEAKDLSVNVAPGAKPRNIKAEPNNTGSIQDKSSYGKKQVDTIRNSLKKAQKAAEELPEGK